METKNEIKLNTGVLILAILLMTFSVMLYIDLYSGDLGLFVLFGGFDKDDFGLLLLVFPLMAFYLFTKVEGKFYLHDKIMVSMVMFMFLYMLLKSL